MKHINGLQNQVINLDEKEFTAVALDIFLLQAEHNPVYKTFIGYLGIDPNDISSVSQIPFLPIELFKTERVITGDWKPEQVFTSSGTGHIGTSKHFVRELKFYEKVSQRTFENFYGPPDRYHILALLPSYLERSGSSLVHMLNHFINESGSKHSGFYSTNYGRLEKQLQALRSSTDRVVMLWGVSFALLELAENCPMELSEAIIIETGGMKGQRKEIIREELHSMLRKAFNCNQLQSEYGMAELTSQAYTLEGRFHTPPWMRVLVRDISDPFELLPSGRVGGINVIDLANIHSCAFIETQDLGEVDENGSFKVLGRMDNSDVRGCNLLWERWERWEQ